MQHATFYLNLGRDEAEGKLFSIAVVNLGSVLSNHISLVCFQNWGESEVQGHSRLNSEFKASLGNLKP